MSTKTISIKTWKRPKKTAELTLFHQQKCLTELWVQFEHCLEELHKGTGIANRITQQYHSTIQ